jgi:ABC-2 type transport system permease protein
MFRDFFAHYFNHRVRALVRKELNQLRRDRRVIMSLVLPPVIQLVLFGSVLNPHVTNLRLGVIDDSRTPESRELIAALTESKSFRIGGVYYSVNDLGNDIGHGKLDAGVVIPYDYARNLERGRTATVQFFLNAMNANTAALGHGYAVGVIQSYNRTMGAQRVRTIQASFQQAESANPGRALGHTIAAPQQGQAVLRPAFLYNPGLINSCFTVSGLLGLLLIMNGSITASGTMVREREAGTLEQ